MFYFKDPLVISFCYCCNEIVLFFCFLFWPWNLQILKMGSMIRVSGCQLTTPPKVVFARSQARSQTCWSLWLVCRWGWFGFPLPFFPSYLLLLMWCRNMHVYACIVCCYDGMHWHFAGSLQQHCTYIPLPATVWEIRTEH